LLYNSTTLFFKIVHFSVKRDTDIPNILFETISLANLMFSLPHYPYQKEGRADNFYLFKFFAFIRLSFLHDSNF